jgi:hypothetical protein
MWLSLELAFFLFLEGSPHAEIFLLTLLLNEGNLHELSVGFKISPQAPF